MKKIFYLFVLVLLCDSVSFAAEHGRKNPVFSQKDIFQSANFIKNAPGLVNDYYGQPVHYFADHDGVTVYFTNAGPVYKLVKYDQKLLKKKIRENARKLRFKDSRDKDDVGEENEEKEREGVPMHITYTQVSWVGANPQPVIEETGKSTGKYSFLAGSSKADYHSILTDGFQKIIYRDIYPGIDVEYSFPDKGGMKYDLIVHPGADASRIRMSYGGSPKIQVDRLGNMTIHTENGDILEHTPVSFTASGKPVVTSYEIRGSEVSFSIPSGYDHSSTLTIDPWVNVLTQLTVRNLGADVDYDVPGNLYVYGAGAANLLDITNYQKVAKFDPNGNFLWVFMGTVPSIGWNTVSGAGADFLSNAKIDRITEEVYVGAALNSLGTQVIRLDSSGVYDNFISAQDSFFREVWSFTQNCYTGDIIAQGGGIGSNLNVTVITPSTGNVTTNNFTGNATVGQDIVSGTYDPSENLYVVMASVTAGTPVNNKLYKVNSSYTGSVWGPIATGYNSFDEADNLPAYYNSFANPYNTNNFNALAANSSYLYYYDGKHLKAFNESTGAAVGTAITIAGYTAKAQGGIAVDNCNNIYLGGKGSILTYTFNGTTFTAGTPISLGSGFTNDTVNDVRYDALNNLLYVTGTGFAGTYVASLSTTCIVSVPFTDTVVPFCAGAVVNVTPDTNGVANPVFSFVWQDTLGNILSQTGAGSFLADTFHAPYSGRFTVRVEFNANCGGTSLIDTFAVVLCNTLTAYPDTTICAGQPVKLHAQGTPAGGAYLWSPGNSTDSTVTVTPGASTTYTVTYTPLVGPVLTDTVQVIVTNNTTVAVNDTSVCNGQSATLYATTSVPGGTYIWSPGNDTTQSITVTPATTTTYTVTYSTAHCGTATGTGTVTTGPNAGPDQFVTCYPLSNTATMGGVGNGTWTAEVGNPASYNITTPNSGTTTITFSDTGLYHFIWTVNGCSDTVSVTVSGRAVAGPPQTVSCAVLPGGSATMAAGGTGTWTAQSGNPGSATITAPGSASTTITAFSAAGLYYFIWTSGNCSDTTSVTVTAAPNAGPAQTVSCVALPGGSATMAATGNGTWSASVTNPGTANITTPSSPTSTITTFSAAGIYYFLWTNGNCTDSTSITVTAKPDAGADVTICPNATATLNATGTGSWSAVSSNPAATTITAPGSASTTVTGFASPGSYAYVWTVNGCTDTAVVTINNPPAVNPSAANITCSNSTGVIDANATGTAPLTYAWSNNTSADSITTTTPGVFTVTVTDHNGCTTVATDSVSNMIITVGITDSIQNVSCYGYNNGQIILYVTPAGINYTYAWSNNASTDTLSGLAPGSSYQVTVTGLGTGCSAVGGPYTITSPGYDSLSITPLDTAIILGDTVQLNSTLTGAYPGISYSWTPNAGLSCDTCPNPILVAPVQDTAKTGYTLTVTYLNGCTVSATDSIQARPNDLIGLPDAFTPNGDGRNDTFKILATSVKDFRMTIYDRWGGLVFESNDINQGWDGTFKGKAQPSEIYSYFFTLTYLNNKVVVKEGTLTLLR